MRRDEFEIKDEKDIQEIIDFCEYGTLSLIYESKPYSVALNFVYFDGSIFFHGAQDGKKIEAIKENPIGSFLIVKPYSNIPSYFFGTTAACPATHFFASVLFEGDLSFIQKGEEKARVLEALMQKLQKDGGYETITYDKAMYSKMLDKVAIIKLLPQNISCKIKVGQNLNAHKTNRVIEKLRNRNLEIDKETIKQIKKYCVED